MGRGFVGAKVDHKSPSRYYEIMDGYQKLDTESETFVDALVESGRFASRDEVLRESLLQMKRREARLAKFDAEIRKGIDDIEAGRTHSVDDVFDRLTKKYRAAAKKERDGQVADIKAGVARGIADADAGRVVDAKQAFNDLRTHFRALSAMQRA